VIAAGTSPLSYFWRENNQPIPGATSSSYTINNVQPSDSGSQFSCLVSNAYGTTVSADASLSISTSLVLNGGFELGSFADWATSGNFDFCSVYSGSPPAHSGIYGAALGPFGSPGYISQTVSTLPGQTYQISCWLYCDGSTPNEFLVFWNGVTVYDGVNIGTTFWTNLQFQASATSTSTPLKLGFRNDNSYFALDDIAVSEAILSAPSFTQATISRGTIYLSWNSQPGLLYQVQYTTNLAQNVWFNLGGEITTNITNVAITDGVTNALRFYRVMAVP
jgi:hypothetical protein